VEENTLGSLSAHFARVWCRPLGLGIDTAADGRNQRRQASQKESTARHLASTDSCCTMGPRQAGRAGGRPVCSVHGEQRRAVDTVSSSRASRRPGLARWWNRARHGTGNDSAVDPRIHPWPCWRADATDRRFGAANAPPYPFRPGAAPGMRRDLVAASDVWLLLRPQRADGCCWVLAAGCCEELVACCLCLCPPPGRGRRSQRGLPWPAVPNWPGVSYIDTC
jgi:hypothetical protein